MAKSESAFTDAVREAVAARAKGRCEICGAAGYVWHFHHRRPRGMGGSSRGESGGAANALMLHPNCHERVEQNRSDAYVLGWLVSQTEDPCKVSVRMHDGWYVLDADGGMTAVSPP